MNTSRGLIVAITLLGLLLFPCCISRKDAKASNENVAEVAKNNNAQEDEKPESKTVEDTFSEDCGCHALYRQIVEDGGQAPDSVAANLINADEKITHKLIVKNPVPYYGVPVVFTGKIAQIFETNVKDGILTEAYIALDRWNNESIFAYGGLHTPFVKGDRVTVVGYMAKHHHKYKSIAQWDMSIPYMVMRQMLKPSDALYLKVPIEGQAAPRDMRFEPGTYDKVFEQDVASNILKFPEKTKSEIIRTALARFQEVTDRNTAHYEKYRESSLLKMTRLMRERAERKATEMLARLE